MTLRELLLQAFTRALVAQRLLHSTSISLTPPPDVTGEARDRWDLCLVLGAGRRAASC